VIGGAATHCRAEKGASVATSEEWLTVHGTVRLRTFGRFRFTGAMIQTSPAIFWPSAIALPQIVKDLVKGWLREPGFSAA
jgi:hypothetical protein